MSPMFMKAAIEAVRADIQRVLAEKGRNATGSLSKSIEGKTIEYLTGFKVEVLMNDYWEVVDSGVDASRVAYYPGSGRRSSEYVKAILKWAVDKRIPFASDKERMSFPHKLGRTHRRVGITVNKQKLGFMRDNTDRYLDVFNENLDYNMLSDLLITNIVTSIAA